VSAAFTGKIGLVTSEPAGGYPPQPVPSYALGDVDQLQAMRWPDVCPGDDGYRQTLIRTLALDAALYGMPGVLQYAHLYKQAVDGSGPGYTGFNRFAHDRELAGPGYRAFKTPNADTLYSNAWLDLTAGPILITVPGFGTRYYTLNFLDMYSNATNISTGTAGGDGGRYLVATTSWTGPIPEGAVLFRVATSYMWLLMRIFVDGPDDLAAARRLQDVVRLEPLTPAEPDPSWFPWASPEAVRRDWRTYYRVLDFLLGSVAHPAQEDALVYRYRLIGLGADAQWDPRGLDRTACQAFEDGYRLAMDMAVSVRSQLGVPLGPGGWSRGYPAAYGFNYLRRAATNLVGLGATVVQENQAFMCWRDADARPLDGSKASYEFTLAGLPPVEAFWSLSAYDARTLEFHPNELDRYVISDRTRGIEWNEDGSLTVRLQSGQPADGNWLPVPPGPFYLAMRAYRPKPALLSGAWRPPPVRPAAEAGAPA